MSTRRDIQILTEERGQLEESFLANRNDLTVRSKLISAYQSNVSITARRFLDARGNGAFRSGVEREDLESECLIALVEAIDTYEPGKSKLATWIINKLNNRAKEFIRQCANQSGSPRSVSDAINALKEAITLYQEKAGVFDPSNQELAAFFGLRCSIYL